MYSVGIIGASGFAGVELLRLCAGHPDLEVVRGHRRLAGRGGGHRAVPEPGRRLPRAGVRAVPGRGLRRARPGLPVPAPRCLTGPRARAAPPGDLAGRRGRRLPAPRRRPLPPLVRRGPHRPRPAGRVRLRAARAVPHRDRQGRRRGRARLLPDRLHPGPRPPGGRRAGRAHRHHRRRRLRGLRGGPAAQAHHHVLHRRRGLHRLRPPRPSPYPRDRAGRGRARRPGAGRGAAPVHPPPRSHEPGDPGHLLRPAVELAVGADVERRRARLPPRRLRRRAVRGGDRRVPVDQGDPGRRTWPT